MIWSMCCLIFEYFFIVLQFICFFNEKNHCGDVDYVLGTICDNCGICVDSKENSKKKGPNCDNLLHDISNLNLNNLEESFEFRLYKLEERLNEKIIGQGEVVTKICDKIRAYFCSNDRSIPLVIILGGPSGSGKTEISSLVAHYLFGDEEFLKFSLSTLTSENAATSIQGSPTGYAGSTEDSLFWSIIKEKPKVVLLDELDKASPEISVFKQFITLFSGGWATTGNNYTFHLSKSGTIFFLTTNAGCSFFINFEDFKKIINQYKELYPTINFDDISTNDDVLRLSLVLGLDSFGNIRSSYNDKRNHCMSDEDISRISLFCAVDKVILGDNVKNIIKKEVKEFFVGKKNEGYKINKENIINDQNNNQQNGNLQNNNLENNINNGDSTDFIEYVCDEYLKKYSNYGIRWLKRYVSQDILSNAFSKYLMSIIGQKIDRINQNNVVDQNNLVQNNVNQNLVVNFKNSIPLISNKVTDISLCTSDVNNKHFYLLDLKYC